MKSPARKLGQAGLPAQTAFRAEPINVRLLGADSPFDSTILCVEVSQPLSGYPLCGVAWNSFLVSGLLKWNRQPDSLEKPMGSVKAVSVLTVLLDRVRGVNYWPLLGGAGGGFILGKPPGS